MDEIDKEIAKIVSKDARIPFKDIARQLGISPQMVIRRYNNLKKTAFAYCSITVNLKKLGFEASVGFTLKIREENHREIDQIYDKITKFPNVIIADKMLGPWDMSFLIPVRSFEEIFKFQEQLASIKGIEKVEMTLYRAHENWPRQICTKLLQEQHEKE
jgi:Lrp/AsnC family transcriptional regulator for asnA, asnC and gidA